MSANQIINAAPAVISLGTQDLSTRVVPRTPESIPQHLPKFYLYAQQGPTTPQLVSGGELFNMYGAKTFDYDSPYANHSTVFINQVNAEGNAVMLQRVVPKDIGPAANIIMWLDVLPTKIRQYERNIDGSIAMDLDGNPIPTNEEADGYTVKWVSTHRATPTSMAGFGNKTIIPGDQVDPLTNIQSQRYPMFEIAASSLGEDGNLSGIRLWSPTNANNNSMPVTMMSTQKAYPYFMSIVKKYDKFSTAKPVANLFGEPTLQVVFKENVTDPLTGGQLYIGDHLLSMYQNLTDPLYPQLFGRFGSLHVYQDNIDFLVNKFHEAEVPFINDWSDITINPDSAHLFNFVGGVSSHNVPYYSFAFANAADTITLTSYSNVMAKGGFDGTMNDQLFAQLVEEEVVKYLDPNDYVQEVAVNVESIMYDTGYPLATKLAMCSFVSNRKDTFVVLSTHDVTQRALVASEEYSLAISLRTRLQAFNESDYFGTHVMRGMVIARSGRLRNSQYKKHLPLSLEIAIKSAKYMGAGNGRWKNGYAFDSAPGNIVTEMYDVNVSWTPAIVRNLNWAVGLNWVQNFDRRSLFFPALKTAYADDTSVLNSYFTAMAIAQLNKVAQAAWRNFTGSSGLTNAQLAKQVNDFITAQTINRFDNRFVIVPNAFFTTTDELQGFSWTVPISIYAPNMKTVMQTYVKAWRISDAPDTKQVRI